MATDAARRLPHHNGNMDTNSPLNTLVRQTSLGGTSRSHHQPSQRNTSRFHPDFPSSSHSTVQYSAPPSHAPPSQFRSGFQPRPGNVLPHNQFRGGTSTSAGNTTSSGMNTSWDSSGAYWTKRQAEEDPYGGLDDDYAADPFAAPVVSHTRPSYFKASGTNPVPTPKASTSFQGKYDAAPPAGSSPLSCLHPPLLLRHPSLRDDGAYRASAASSQSAYSQQLGVDLATDNRSTWRSDISGSTSADAFVFRDYESPQPPKVIVTGPMTPRMDGVGERERHWNRPEDAENEEPQIVIPPSKTLQDNESAGDVVSSASGKTRSLYNAANFSRPLRGPSSAPDPSNLDGLERPDSVASSYSSSSSTYTAPVPRAPVGRAGSQPDSTIIPLSILRSSAYSSVPSSDGPSESQNKSISRKPSIRFQDPRPPPPVPPPPQQSRPFYTASPPVRSLSTSIRGGATVSSSSGLLRSQSASSVPRAQLIEQARNRAPPLPPVGINTRRTANGELGTGHSDGSRSSPADQPYDRYSYYDPDSVVRSPVAGPSSPRQPPHLAPPDRPNVPSSHPRNRSRAGPPSPSSDLAPAPQTAEDYLQLGITHHLANNLTESAYCFEISAKGIGALKGRPSLANSSTDHGSSSAHGAVCGEDSGCGVGMLMWGLTLRSGWGVEKDEKKGFKWLRRAAEHAVEDLEMSKAGQDSRALQSELVLAIYEVGQCFFHGWGIQQDKKMAVSYFLVAARLGDSDAQQELGFCYLNGKGCKRDKREAAKWYRLAADQGASTVGLAWIYKDKYM